MEKELFAALLSLLVLAVHAAPSATVTEELEVPDTPNCLPSPLSEEILNRHLIPDQNCKETYDLNKQMHGKNGLYVVQPGDGEEFVVYCDMTQLGGGWTLIQRRVDSSVDFRQSWEVYRNGFGDLYGNFWLGLEKIRRLTNSGGVMELYVGLEGYDYINEPPPKTHRLYDSFRLETDEYKLYVHKCTSPDDLTDSLQFHNGQPFSTYDKDNDASSLTNCADKYGSGWWFKGCLHSNLNGIYYEKDESHTDKYGIVWFDWHGDKESLNSTVMAIRPVAESC